MTIPGMSRPLHEEQRRWDGLERKHERQAVGDLDM